MPTTSNKPFRLDLWGDRALYRDALKLSKAQAVGAIVYALAGTVAGLLMVGLSIRTLLQGLGEYGPLILFPLILPLFGGMLVLVIAVRIGFNALRRLAKRDSYR
jgi:hypothetical protein